MDNNFKLRIIGYYTGEKQNMNPEKRFPAEAEELANLFGKTFSDTFSSVEIDQISDKKFVKSLSSNTVYIFQDEDRNLYAYYPKKQIARLSSVFYDRKNINKIPIVYKSWFVPGNKIPFIAINDKRQHKTNKHGIFLCDIDGNDIEFSNEDFTISTAGGDFLIRLQNIIYALDWPSSKRISISELNRLIKHKWTYLNETDTDDECEDCDGYDYSDCDMNRCKDDCEHCSGRQYVCNDSCFYHRYKTCLKIISDNSLIEEELKEGMDLLHKISAPNSKHDIILQEKGKYLESLYNDCLYIDKYVRRCYPAQEYIYYYDKMLEKENDRNNVGQCIDLEVVDGQEHHRYRMLTKSVRTGTCGFFWLKDKLVLEGYDFITDDNIKEKFVFKIPNSVEKKAFHKIEEEWASISRIKITIKEAKATLIVE